MFRPDPKKWPRHGRPGSKRGKSNWEASFQCGMPPADLPHRRQPLGFRVVRPTNPTPEREDMSDRTVRPAMDLLPPSIEEVTVDRGGGVTEKWDIYWINPEYDANWKDTLTNRLGKAKPLAQDIHSGLSGGKDFYLWYKHGANPKTTWEIYPVPVTDNPSWKDAILAQLSSTAWDARLVGFNNADHNAMWMLRCS